MDDEPLTGGGSYQINWDEASETSNPNELNSNSLSKPKNSQNVIKRRETQVLTKPVGFNLCNENRNADQSQFNSSIVMNSEVRNGHKDLPNNQLFKDSGRFVQIIFFCAHIEYFLKLLIDTICI